MKINTVSPTPQTAESSGVGPIATETADKIKNMAPDQSRAIEQKEEESPPAEEIKELAQTLNEYMDGLQTDLGFFMHEKLNHQVIVEIKNRKTDELIKQIPSEELVMIKEKMAELTGLLFDTSI
ncbi:MAG: flagellar protein FlaG [Desulfobacter postgatei]|uniref:flagellar protein FlaG n=1 Tax=Desulfobacter postgatei TaxID=2293 RepID=UPI0023F570A2|nr:flagellar protein FlaG [Desulfobacter postgatei]MDD4273755.1 flagellar protein FlaG [Desulfobacter postgatei]MDX9964321.1 flagellar protein FlaG [Desulfobacter postgatei]